MGLDIAAERKLQKETAKEKEQRQAETVGLRESVIVGIDIPFWHLIKLLVKLSLASLPAAVIVIAIVMATGDIIAWLQRSF